MGKSCRRGCAKKLEALRTSGAGGDRLPDHIVFFQISLLLSLETYCWDYFSDVSADTGLLWMRRTL